MRQTASRGHEASSQSGLGVDCKLFFSSKKLRGLGVRAQALRLVGSLVILLEDMRSAMPKAPFPKAPAEVQQMGDELEVPLTPK